MVESEVEPSAAAAAAAAAAASSSSNASILPTSINPLASPESSQSESAAADSQAALERQKTHDDGVEAEKSLAIAGEIIASVSSRERELEVREAELRAAIRNNYDKIQSVEAELLNLRRGEAMRDG